MSLSVFQKSRKNLKLSLFCALVVLTWNMTMMGRLFLCTDNLQKFIWIVRFKQSWKGSLTKKYQELMNTYLILLIDVTAALYQLLKNVWVAFLRSTVYSWPSILQWTDTMTSQWWLKWRSKFQYWTTLRCLLFITLHFYVVNIFFQFIMILTVHLCSTIYNKDGTSFHIPIFEVFSGSFLWRSILVSI